MRLAARLPAGSGPTEPIAAVETAINTRDIDALCAAYDRAATIVVPLLGRSAHGHHEIRAAIAPLLDLRPEVVISVTSVLEADGIALSHGRWTLVIVDGGCRSELRGLGTTVSRRAVDGTWKIVLDNPMTAP